MASQIETFHQPIREIEARFTKSELTLFAWRSQEQVYQMRKKYDQPAKGRSMQTYDPDQKEGIPEGVPDKFFDESGQIDLRNVTGDEALKYFSSMGINIPHAKDLRKK